MPDCAVCSGHQCLFCVCNAPSVHGGTEEVHECEFFFSFSWRNWLAPRPPSPPSRSHLSSDSASPARRIVETALPSSRDSSFSVRQSPGSGPVGAQTRGVTESPSQSWRSRPWTDSDAFSSFQSGGRDRDIVAAPEASKISSHVGERLCFATVFLLVLVLGDSVSHSLMSSTCSILLFSPLLRWMDMCPWQMRVASERMHWNL